MMKRIARWLGLIEEQQLSVPAKSGRRGQHYYDITYSDGPVIRVSLGEEGLRHFRRALRHPNSKVVKITPVMKVVEEE